MNTMNKKHAATLLGCIALLFSSAMAVSVDGQNPVSTSNSGPQKLDLEKKTTWNNPSTIPDRIVLTVTENPATSLAITWRSNTFMKKAYVEFAIAEDGPKFVRKLVRQVASTERLQTKYNKANYHSITLENLKPETKYVYRVGFKEHWSEFSHFTTASKQTKPFSFIYFGDAQNDLKSHWSRVVREAFREQPKAAFLLHAGDLVNRANSDSEWGEWFYGCGWINRTLPSIAIPGNHEYSDGVLSDHWRKTFTLPANGPSGLEETAYYVDYQGVRIIALDTNTEIDLQAEWFERIMSNNESDWTIVTMHHPVFSTSKNRNNSVLRSKLLPLFEKYHVDIVLQGHDHAYGRTGLVSNQDARRVTAKIEMQSDGNETTTLAVKEPVVDIANTSGDQWGTVYVVSVSGPKMYTLSDKRRFQELYKSNAEKKQLFQILSVDGDKLEYSAYTVTGKIYDQFVLQKQTGQVNKLIELQPNQSPSQTGDSSNGK